MSGAFADDEQRGSLREDGVEAVAECVSQPEGNRTGDVMPELFVRIVGVAGGAVEETQRAVAFLLLDVEQDGAGLAGIGIYLSLVGSFL